MAGAQAAHSTAYTAGDKKGCSYCFTPPMSLRQGMNLSDDEDVDRTWGNIKENIKTSAKESLGLYELKQNKPGLMKNV